MEESGLLGDYVWYQGLVSVDGRGQGSRKRPADAKGLMKGSDWQGWLQYEKLVPSSGRQADSRMPAGL